MSASVNLTTVATGIAAGISRWRFRNIGRGRVLKLAVTGCAGALLGATVLSRVNGAKEGGFLGIGGTQVSAPNPDALSVRA